MIDWLKVRYDFQPSPIAAARLYGGEVMIIEATGAVRWRKVKPLEMRGSYETALHVSIDAMTGTLLVDGNPAKYFQGHNVFGTWSVRGLALAVFDHVCAQLDLTPAAIDRGRVEHGSFELLRVDLTESYHCGNLQRARSVLESIATYGHLRQSRHSRGLLDQGTLYYRKRSRRWAAKFYCKGQELAAHAIAGELEEAAEVEKLAQGLLRLEFVMRAMELKTRGLNRGHMWCDTTGPELFEELRAKLELPMFHELPSDALDAMTVRLRAIYIAWKAGEDVRLLCSKASFYRYRQALRAYGIDIATRQAKEISNVVPLVQLIELRPLGVPEQFVGTDAYFDPRIAA